MRRPSAVIRGLRSAWLGGVLVLSAAGCNAIFGLEQGEPFPKGNTAGESGTGGTAAANGGESGDGGAGLGGSGSAGKPEGSGGLAGSMAGRGAAGAPSTAYFTRVRARPSSKLDLLLMIDNSVSMADKQQILAEAMPSLVGRLVQPICIDDDGKPLGANADAQGRCSQGAPEFELLKDIHIGIITSSLGDHGSGDLCSEAQNLENASNGLGSSYYDDLGELLPSVRSDLPSWNDSGFLSWDPNQLENPPGTLDPADLVADFTDHVLATGQTGCGYEAALEAWYRFLIDPEPVQAITNDGQVSVRGDVNDVVLAQREAFLRPDSLVAIMLLSDENDCSIIDEDGTQGWLVGYKGGVGASSFVLPRASSSCANPDDECCRNCTLPERAGCPSNAEDSVCSKSTTLTRNDDNLSQRCFAQRSRFGIDLLYPVDRYVSALTDTMIDPRLDGKLVQNPLFAPRDGLPARATDMVVLGGIVGVPWQDIATTESFQDPRSLIYMSAAELDLGKRWDVILGDPAHGVPPSDPLMRESIDPRPGGSMHPLFGNAAIVDASATENENPINGHEQHATNARDDLQFACIFPLNEPIPCTDANANECDCNVNEAEKNSPLCHYDAPDTDGTQVYAKAYPGLRELEVLKKLGPKAMVASICPKNVTSPASTASDPDYGYNPAILGLLQRLKEGLGVSCLPRELPLDLASGENAVACDLIEARVASDCTCDGSTGRRTPDGTAADADTKVRNRIEADGQCGGESGIDCNDMCLCEVLQLEGNDLESCQNAASVSGGVRGFCYVDPGSGIGEPIFARTCPASSRRVLRFVGSGLPATGALTYLSCP